MLKLGENQITEVEPSTFKDMTNLNHINLNNNKIKTVGEGVFANQYLITVR